MTTLPEKTRGIDPAMLSEGDYFLSLLDQGLRLGLVTNRNTERILSGCMDLLREVTERYTRGGSSSVRVETAQGLLEGVCFTIGVALKAMDSPAAALDALVADGPEGLYRAGRRRIDRKLLVARTLHRQLVRDLFPTPNVYCNATLTDGIAGFFKLYQPDFAPQEMHITADYPTCVPVGRVRGVEFIERYLAYLTCENRFLRTFSPAAVHALLLRRNPDYAETPSNLLEPVLTQALGCALAGRSTDRLELGADALTGLERMLHGITRNELRDILYLALPKGFGAETDAYLIRCLDPVSFRIHQAAALGTLTRTFPV